MDLVFLHGAPATGKYTVGRELAARTGFELYHNHLVVDAVLERHAFGTPEFVAERDRAWRDHLGTAARDNARGLIFTFNPENTVPQAFIDWLFHELPRTRGAAIHSVELTADEVAIESRLGAGERRNYRKLADLALYRQLRDAGAFRTPIIPRSDLRIDTSRVNPIEAAQEIARRFALC